MLIGNFGIKPFFSVHPFSQIVKETLVLLNDNSEYLREDSLRVSHLGELTDMSGTNDAFNSSICRLEV